MRTIIRVLVVLGLVLSVSSSPARALPNNGSCSSEVRGGYTCTTCVSPGGGVVEITCVPTVRR